MSRQKKVEKFANVVNEHKKSSINLMPVRLHITDLISRLRFMLNAYTHDLLTEAQK